MHLKVILSLCLVFLLSSSSSSSSSSLNSIVSILTPNEGETEVDYTIHPPFLRLLRLLSSRDLTQQSKAEEPRPPLLALQSILAPTENEAGRKRELADDRNREARRRKWEKDNLPPLIIEEIKDMIKQFLEELYAEVNDVFFHVIGYYLPSNATVSISQECMIDVDNDNFLANFHELWFLKMFDSWGKFPDGYLFGNLRAPGMFEECVKLRVEYQAKVEGEVANRTYKGRYCNINYRPLPINITTPAERGEEKTVSPGLRSGVSLATLANPLPFSYGTCVPSTCTTQDVQDSINEVLNEDGYEVVAAYCHDEDDETNYSYTGEDKAMMSILGCFGGLVLLATIYDVIVLCCNISSFQAVLNFSLLSNLGALFTYESGKQTGDVITCLPMLRVVTMIWIIICHQYETNASFTYNFLDSLAYQDPVIAQIVTNGWLSVDTFFFMTGLILSFRLVPYLRPDRGIWTHLKILVTVVVRRIVRLAPVILCVALFCASLLRFLGWGPRQHILYAFSQENCLEHWWKDPIFVNNYLFPGNEGDEVNDCLSNCWYTAVDVQLLVLLPIIFLPFVYHQVAGVFVLCVLSIASVIVPLAITLAYDLPPSPLHHLPGEERLKYMTHIFLVPWARAGPWVVGIWTGLLLRIPRVQAIRMNKLFVFFGYVAAISLGLTLVIGLFPYNHIHVTSNGVVEREWQDYPAISALYGSLARPVWGLCVAWVVFTCHTGNAEIVNQVLSYPGWLPMARLTFAMYVVAPVVQLWWSTVQLQPTYFNYLSKLFESSGVISITLLIAILLTCFVELPVMRTCNILLPSPAKEHERNMLSKYNSKYNNNNSDKFERSKSIPLKTV